MGKILTSEDAIQRPHLVEYDAADPSSHFSLEQIRYFESLPGGLSEKALANLRETEWFVLNRNSGYFTECAVPGLRARPGIEVGYVKRFTAASYVEMMDVFLDCIPADFPRDQCDHYNMPAYRLTSLLSEKFYPIVYNGNLPAWRKRLQDCATSYGTVIGRFIGGAFTVSDGREIDLGDMVIDWVGPQPDPPDW